MKFKVFDNKTGKEADPYEIALHEEWAKCLVYCDMEGFAITEDGNLVLMDECENVVYCDTERFKVVLEDERQHGEWIPCSERLPKAGEYVGNVAKYYLVQNEYGDMLVARYTHSGDWEQIYQLKLYDDEIVAWMPLPEPYMKEGEAG